MGERIPGLEVCGWGRLVCTHPRTNTRTQPEAWDNRQAEINEKYRFQVIPKTPLPWNPGTRRIRMRKSGSHLHSVVQA